MQNLLSQKKGIFSHAVILDNLILNVYSMSYPKLAVNV